MKTLTRIALFLALFQAAACLAAPVSIQVTLGASATQISATLNCRWFTIQNNAAHSARAGDSTVTSSKGVYLAAGPGGGSWQPPIVQGAGIFNLAQWYIVGTSSDVIDVTCDSVAF